MWETFGNNISWLMTTPAGDINFKSALARATDDEIREVICLIEGKSGTKTKVAELQRELRKRGKNEHRV